MNWYHPFAHFAPGRLKYLRRNRDIATILRISGGALAIATFGILTMGMAVYRATSETVDSMATGELTHLVDATANMVHQATSQAVTNSLRAIAKSNYEIVSHAYDEYRAGRIAEAEARRSAGAVLLSQSVGTSGYVYCLNSKGVITIHPKPTLVGTDLTRHAFIREQLRRRDGYLEYSWRNPGETNERPKALYMSYFAPWDWIISVSTYRDEMDSLVSASDFRDDILSITIGRTGYLYVIDAKDGTFVVHPTNEGTRLASVRDADGRPLPPELQGRRNGKAVYWWRNPGETKPRQMLIVHKYLPAFNWMVAGGAYLDELGEPLHRVRIALGFAFAGTCLVALLLAVVLGRRVVSAQRGAEAALRSALNTTEQIINMVPFALVLVGNDGTVRRANDAADEILKSQPGSLVGRHWEEFVPRSSGGGLRRVEELEARDSAGNTLHVLMSTIPATIAGEDLFIEAFLDLTERRRLEAHLRHAQKFEAVGQLAAGIAHEINTPAQYVGDSIHFLAESFKDEQGLLTRYRQAVAELSPSIEHEAIRSQLTQAEEAADSGFVEENAPAAFARALDGISRISTIVCAMKEFAHPDQREKSPAELNRALQATLTIARNEYKYVADVETDLGAIPPVPCHLGELNQVFLNLLVNASHAISDLVGESGNRGRIRVRTAQEGDAVRIDITDTGCGIPDNIRDRVFDPFFTTKEIGRGSGQGLSIARSVIVDKHGGFLTFESEIGKGTTFTIRIPIDASSAGPAVAATAEEANSRLRRRTDD